MGSEKRDPRAKLAEMGQEPRINRVFAAARPLGRLPWGAKQHGSMAARPGRENVARRGGVSACAVAAGERGHGGELQHYQGGTFAGLRHPAAGIGEA